MQLHTMNYDIIPEDEIITKTAEALTSHTFETVIVNTKEEALEKIKSLIPAGASVQNGASETLKQIGFIDYLKEGMHGWNNLHEGILAEADPVKQKILRKQATLADFYLGSVHGISQTGELVVASATGSQLPNIVYSSDNVIFVASAKKIMPTLAEAIERLEKHVFPQEDARMQSLGWGNSYLSEMVVLHRQHPTLKRNIHVILVKENLGF